MGLVGDAVDDVADDVAVAAGFVLVAVAAVAGEAFAGEVGDGVVEFWVGLEAFDEGVEVEGDGGAELLKVLSPYFSRF